ncbi:hypothetical protein Q8F55_003236 [Vanrija albida]|uniref:FAD/NAD(P)-binding domain-containing protein n=1 Tax=Vanrija albida TaxID=181172 RepID=A0ABR3QBX9_9TREE
MAATQGISITVANGSYKKPAHMDFSWAPELYEHPIREARHVKIICIGAGFSGLCAAIHFQENLENYDLTIYERQDDVGGVWHQNTYPGVACDVPAHAYQFSFAEKTDWSAYYAPGAEISGYLRDVAERYGLRRYIRLSHSVQWARWDAARDKWVVCVRDDATGAVVEDEADFVVFATGLLSKPLWPSNIHGREDYAGKLVHSGDWKAAGLDNDPHWSWEDKRVGVIGMGASGVQLVPALQRKAKSVVNFGRSKLWLSAGWGSKMLQQLQPRDKPMQSNYHFTDGDLAQFRNPEVYRLFRTAIEEDLGSTHELTLRNHPLQDVFAAKFTQILRHKTAAKPEVGDAILPDFPVGCKRLTPGPGYLEALCQDNCSLVTDRIECFTPTGIRTADGTEHGLDVIVCATGFDVSFRPAFPIYGLNGNMQDVWAKEARTYLGLFAAELPNSFNLLTTQSAVGSGSLLVVAEQQCAYMTKAIAKCQRDGYASFVAKRRAVDDFIAFTDDYFARTVLTTNCKSWYKHADTGIIRAIWPGSGSHSFVALQDPRWEDFEWERVKARGMKHSMSWLGNGTAPQLDGGAVHLAMRDFYKTHVMF